MPASPTANPFAHYPWVPQLAVRLRDSCDLDPDTPVLAALPAVIPAHASNPVAQPIDIYWRYLVHACTQNLAATVKVIRHFPQPGPLGLVDDKELTLPFARPSRKGEQLRQRLNRVLEHTDGNPEQWMTESMSRSWAHYKKAAQPLLDRFGAVLLARTVLGNPYINLYPLPPIAYTLMENEKAGLTALYQGNPPPPPTANTIALITETLRTQTGQHWYQHEVLQLLALLPRFINQTTYVGRRIDIQATEAWRSSTYIAQTILKARYGTIPPAYLGELHGRLTKTATFVTEPVNGFHDIANDHDLKLTDHNPRCAECGRHHTGTNQCH